MGNRMFVRLTIGALLIIGGSAFLGADRLDRLFSSYAKDELKYFEEVAFRDDRLYRWRQPIRIQLEGDQKAFSASRLDEIIQEIQPLLDGTEISRSEAGNLIIYHSPTLQEYVKNYSQPGQLPLGYAKPKLAATEIMAVDVYLHPLLLPEKKMEVLKHELCHALGLLQHARAPYSDDNLLGIPASGGPNKQKGKGLIFSRLDKAAIRLLYDQRIHPNFSKKDFLRRIDL